VKRRKRGNAFLTRVIAQPKVWVIGGKDELGAEVTPFNPDFAVQMDAAGLIMRENRDALRKLAR
jgi:hypothetical protein